MNVGLIVETVVGEVCDPFLSGETMWGSIAEARRAGYEVRHILPGTIRLGAADAQPEPNDVTLHASHAGTIRIWRQGRLRFCSVGIPEGAAGRTAEIAEPLVRARGLEPVLDERDAPFAVSVWRGAGRQAVISRSSEFRPGSEIIITSVEPQVD